MNTATLDLARNPQVSLDTLAQLLGESPAYVAGLVEAITGDADYRHAQQMDGIEPTAAERDAYQRGWDAGIELADAAALDAAHGTLADWAAALDADAIGARPVAS